MKKVLSGLFIVFACLFLLGMPKDTYAETSGDYEYDILKDGTAEIVSYLGSEKTVEIPAELDGYVVTGIGGSAFHQKGIESVKFPETITFISSSSYGHNELIFTEEEMFYGKGAFRDCSNLKSVELNEGLKSIGSDAFAGCNLEKLVIPDTVESIGDYAFSDNEFEQLTIPDSVVELGDYVFENSSLSMVYVGKGAKTLDNTFMLSNVSFIDVDKENLNYADVDGVLTNCNKTELIYYPEGREAVSYTVPAGIKKIGDSVFTDHDYLEAVTISKDVESLSASGLRGYVLKNVYVSKNNPAYVADGGVLFNKTKTKIIMYPRNNSRTSYNIPAGVTVIGREAFYGCHNLGNINFSDSVKTIEKGAFSHCGQLTAVTIGKQVTVIGENAFEWCNAVKTINIGNSVKKINANAFYGCTKIHSIKIPSSVNFIGENALHSDGEWMNSDDFREFSSAEVQNIYYAGNQDKWKQIKGASQYKPDKYNYCTKAGVKHNYTKAITKATRSHNGKYDTKCTKCGDIKTQGTVIYKINKINLSYTKAAYSGKVKTPNVTVTNSKGKKLTKGTDYTVKYEKGRKIVGTYTVTITFKGKYYGTVKKTFDIVPKKAEVRSLTKGKQKFTVKWKKVTSQITGYQIRYSTASNMSNAKTVKVTNYKTTSKTIKSLKAKKKYYVQVRIYKKAEGKTYYGNWSGKKYVITR